MGPSPTHDAAGRRHRTRAVSTDKRVTLQPRDRLWLEILHRHGPLASSWLHAFSRDLCRNPKRARDRLTDLFNEDRTPHGGAYLLRPHQQFAILDARYRELVYDLAPAGERALKRAGTWHPCAGGASGPWWHRHMVARVTAAIELETLGRDDVEFIPQHAILERAGRGLRWPVPFKPPGAARTREIDLIPDALFGLEYRIEGKSRFRFFAVEADRGTEPATATAFNRKSYQRSLLQYRTYVGDGLYKDHLKLSSGLIVLNVTKSPSARHAMLRLAGNIYPRGCSYQLFVTADEDLDVTGWRDCLAGPLARCGHPDFFLFAP